VINKATFTKKNGVVVLLCSECGKTIKTQKEFNAIERYAYNGVTSLESQYCDEHSYINMSIKDRKEEMSKRSIKEKLIEGITKYELKFKELNQKNKIKAKLLESPKGYNCLGVKISRPSQVLIIMRGVP
jgi:pyruvate/2-oxoacid:ferredoxin oxidoreductase beta subunit